MSLRALVVMSLLMLPGCVHAQPPAGERCAVARAVIERAASQGERGALDVIPTCGREGAAALARGFPVLRWSSDVPRLDAYLQVMRLWRDASLYEAALNVAADRGASVRARVFAFGYLLTLVSPGDLIQYEVLGAGLDENGLPLQPCSRVVSTSHGSLDSAPLPTDWRQRLQVIARGIYKDETEPSAVRSAAFCST